MNPTAPKVQRLSHLLIQQVGERALVGVLAGLVVARPLVSAADPGRLQLTAPSSAVSFNLVVWVLLLAYAVWAMLTGRRVRLKMTLLVAVAAGAIFAGSYQAGYLHAAHYVAWEWLTLAAVCFVCGQVITTAEDRRGMVNVLLASVLSISLIGLCQQFGPRLGFPSTEPEIPDARPGLVGSDEFQSSLNETIFGHGTIRGTLDSPAVYFIYLVLGLPLLLLCVRTFRHPLRWALVAWWLAALGVVCNTAWNLPEAASRDAWTAVKLLGIGGGNYSRHLPTITSGSAWLSFLVTGGVVAAVLLVIACLALARVSPTTPTIEAAEPLPKFTRWEFYYGGIGGLLLGFIWFAGQMPAEAAVWEVYKIGGYAVVRGAIWLALFGLFEKAAYQPKMVLNAFKAVAAVIIVSGFFLEAAGNMVILFHLMIIIGMVLGHEATSSPHAERRPGTISAVMVCVCVAAASALVWYILMVAGPAWQTSNATRRARLASQMYPDIERQIDIAKNQVERANTRTTVMAFLKNQIINPLRKASSSEPRNATLRLEIARWQRTLWKIELVVNPEEASNLTQNILQTINKAATLDPKNVSTTRANLEALLLFRQESKSKKNERLTLFYSELNQLVATQPKLEVPYRYRMINVLFLNGDTDAVERDIGKLFTLNRVEGQPHGALTEFQRQDLLDRAKQSLKNPPAELLEEWIR